MNKKLTFGILLGPVPPYQDIATQAKLMESLGFDKLWLPDHFVNPHVPQMGWFDGWTLLSALATQTHRAAIGTMVSSMTLRNPAVLVKMAMTVDHISAGRLELGIGAAGTPFCHSMTGVPRWAPRERSERFKEFVEIVDHMLRNDVTTYHGEYYDIQEAWLQPRPVAKPRPVLSVAAHGPKSLRLAARYGDAWNSYFPGKDLPPEQNSRVIHERNEYLSECAQQEGRKPELIGRSFLFGWTSDKLFRSMEAFYDTIGRYREAGIDDFILLYVPGDDWMGNAIPSIDLLERIALEAIPKIRLAG